MNDQRSLRIAGAAFGVWLSFLYAVVADQINRIYLPGVPLGGPAGGYLGYYLGAIAAGLLVGLASAWFDNAWLSALLAGVIGAVLVFLAPWQQAWGFPESSVGTLILTVTTFLPLTLILTPFGLLIRFAIEHLPTQLEGALSLRRIGLPLLGTGLAILFGYWTLYPAEVRDGMRTMQQLLQSGMSAQSQETLPENLREVQGFKPNATGSYTLEYSQNVDKFMGLHPVSNRMGSDFLVIARYKNGFSMACIFAPGVKTIPCANFEIP